MKITLTDGREYEVPFEPGQRVLVIEHECIAYTDPDTFKPRHKNVYSLRKRTLAQVSVDVGLPESVYDPIEPDYWYYKVGCGEQTFSPDPGEIFSLDDRETAEEVVRLKNDN